MQSGCPDPGGWCEDRRARAPHNPEESGIGDVAAAWLLLVLVAGVAAAILTLLGR